MALHIYEKPVDSGGFDWDRWYTKNRERLSEKRARRYREDTKYRQAALERSKKQRLGKKPLPAGEYTIPFPEMAQNLGVTIWVLREWRKKDYFPEPKHRDGRMWFKPSQQALLNRLRLFFHTYGARVALGNRSALDDVVSLVYSNW